MFRNAFQRSLQLKVMDDLSTARDNLILGQPNRFGLNQVIPQGRVRSSMTFSCRERWNAFRDIQRIGLIA